MNIHQLYFPFLKYFRSRRMRVFCNHFNVTPRTTIVDVGGSGLNWCWSPTMPVVVAANLYRPNEPPDYQVKWVVADGRHLPFKDGAFDVAYSNSVIEHLGNDTDQRVFAAEIVRVGQRFYVQTPNRWFPVEPHLLTPFIHFLSKSWQRRLLRRFTVWGMVAKPSAQQCDHFLEEVHLLTHGTVRRLFPRGRVLRERFFGLTKSLIAVDR